ncbi:MAG: hydroxyacid dehydrogenase [Peptococcaceae bacterium]|jgi:D-3-phosphoglycerate dehydrogenase|nr:hydroxyacid dehydrogenase [Peptococcaceae bacterium]
MKILLTKKLSEAQRAMLESPQTELAYAADGDLTGFLAAIADADALLLSTSFKVDAGVIGSARRLKVISRTGVGVDNVDVAAATEKKILVLNTPDANAVSVAEHTVAFIGALSKQLFYLGAELRKGNFRARRENRPADVDGKILGLAGCGRIGKMVAQKCAAAFNMKVIGYDPYLSGGVDGIQLFDRLDDVLRQADFVSLHLPLTEQTRRLIDGGKLALLKPTAFIINTSRGGVIDEEALAEALYAGKIAGAGIDVFENEPPAETHPLLNAPGAVLTPHSAALTRECAERVLTEAVAGIADYCAGRAPRFIFNRADLKGVF